MKVLAALLLLTTVAFGQNELTYTQIKAAHKIPKWATTVCFVETFKNEDEPAIPFDWNKREDTASGFIVYGPQRTIHLRTLQFVRGKPSHIMNWNRSKDTANGVVNFLNLTPGTRNSGGFIGKFQINWNEKARFTITLDSTNTGQQIVRLDGHCKPID